MKINNIRLVNDYNRLLADMQVRNESAEEECQRLAPPTIHLPACRLKDVFSAMDGEDTFVYTNVLASVLFLAQGPGVFHGFSDVPTLEYVACQGDTVRALVNTQPLSDGKKEYFQKIKGNLPGLPFVDGSQDKPDKLPVASEIYSMPTSSLTEAFQTIGLSDAAKASYDKQLYLLQEKRMVFPASGKLDPYTVRPSPFGQQCGLVCRVTLEENSQLMQYELRVLVPAIEFFCQAVAYPVSHRVTHDGGSSLSARLERLKDYMPSVVPLQEPLWGGAEKSIRKALATSVHRLWRRLAAADDLDDGPLHLWYTILLAAHLNVDEDHHRTSFLEIASRVACNAPEYDEIRDPDSNVYMAIRALALLVISKDSSPLLSGMRVSLEQRLRNSTGFPLAEVTLAEYLQTVAMLCESSYPLWAAENNNLFSWIDSMGLSPSDTLGRALKVIEIANITPEGKGYFRYILLVQPLAVLAPHPDNIKYV